MSNMQQQMTPFYASASTAGDDQRSHYNGNGYYNNYGYSSNQAPPHPEASVAWQNGSSPSTAHPSAVGVDASFSSAPPPTLQDLYSEFGPSTPTPLSSAAGNNQNNGSFDLLDGSYNYNSATAATMYHNDLQTAALLAAQQESQLTASSRAVIATTDDIPGDIIASQERAMAEAKQRQQSNTNTSTSQEQRQLVTLPEGVMTSSSSNPTGSDAVHPNRATWKKTRGSKTAAGVAGGAIVGGVMFGPAFPIGMVLGGATGGYAANKLSKTGERRAQRKWEQSSYQRDADHSSVVTHTMV
jgi:hypothetical protein